MRLIIIFVCSLFFAWQTVLSEHLTLGVLEIPESYDSKNTMNELILDLVSRPMLYERDGESYPASRVSIEFLPASRIIRWGRENVFSNGSPLLVEDVDFSLKRCIPSCSYQLVELHDGIRFSCIEEEKFSCCSRLLHACPIFQKSISDGFHDYFLSGTNLVSNGPYTIVSMIPGKKLLFIRNARRSSGIGAPESITMKVIESSESGLRLLRRGHFGALLVPIDKSLRARISKDETLRISTCKSLTLIHRQELRLRCNPFIGFEVPDGNQAEKRSYETRMVEETSSNQ